MPKGNGEIHVSDHGRIVGQPQPNQRKQAGAKAHAKAITGESRKWRLEENHCHQLAALGADGLQRAELLQVL